MDRTRPVAPSTCSGKQGKARQGTRFESRFALERMRAPIELRAAG
jgi:hypothetical protein